MATEKVAQRDAFGKSLVELADKFPQMVVFDADVCTSTQTAAFRQLYPQRFYQMGISEANMVAAAAAMSTLGFIPVVSTFAAFLAHRASDQVRVGVGYAASNVKLNGAYGGLPTGKAGATHSAIADLAVMRTLPGIKILVPADATEVELATELALSTPGPVYLRTTRDPIPVLFDKKTHRLDWAQGLLLEDGDDVGLISTGMMTAIAGEAVTQLQKHGLRPALLHLASLQPVDEEAISRLARRCSCLVTIENHSQIGGLGSLVAEIITDSCPAALLRIGFPHVYTESGATANLFAKMKMDAQAIVDRTIAFVDKVKTGISNTIREVL